MKKQWARREGILLCQPLDEKKLARCLLTYAYAQPKLDGMRCRAEWFPDLNTYLLFSSEGNLIETCAHIVLTLNDWRAALLAAGTLPLDELDGEIYRHGWPFEQIMSQASNKRARGVAYDLEYHIFDVILEGIPFAHRLLAMERLISPYLTPDLPIRLVPSHRCNNIAEVWKEYKTFMDMGYEGIIIRDATGLYQRKRVPTVLKFKPKKKDWYKIIEVLEAFDENGYPLNRAGSFLCQNEHEHKNFSVGMGAGISHAEMVLFWDQREYLRGKYAEIEYQALTYKNGVPRFGKIVRVTASSGEMGEMVERQLLSEVYSDEQMAELSEQIQKAGEQTNGTRT